MLSKKSGRNFLKLPATVNQRFHPTILARMLATKTELGINKSNESSRVYQATLYRPDSMKEMLRGVRDPAAYCENWAKEKWLPGLPDAMDEPLRKRLPRLLRELSG